MTGQIAKGCLMFWYSCLPNTWNKFMLPTVGIVLMTIWTSEAVSLSRYSSLLVMTLGFLVSVFLPERGNSRERVEQYLHGDKTWIHCWCVSLPFEAAKGQKI